MDRLQHRNYGNYPYLRCTIVTEMRILKAVLLAGALAASLSASLMECPTQPLSVYIADHTSCQIGALIFNNFGYSPNFIPSQPGPPASEILVTPLNDPVNPGIEFSSSAWSVSGLNSKGDSGIGYLIQSVSGAPIIGGVDLVMTDSIASEPVNLVLGETMCLGQAIDTSNCPTSDTLFLQLRDTTSPFNNVPSATFAPVSEASVFKDVFFASAGATGNGQVLTVENIYPMPEPVTPLLSLSGLLAFGWAARRRRTG